MNPYVSIVIPCYNQGEYIEESVDSVLKQSFKDIEIIIVNDGSTDKNTIDIINNIRSSQIKKIQTENRGLSSARNIGIQQATGLYILPLDADDKIAPTYIEKAKEILDNNIDIGIVYCEVDLFDKYRQYKWELPNYSFPEILLRNVIISSALFRKSDWIKVRGYRSSMYRGWEDYDFWLSLIEIGNKVFRIPEVLFYYRQHKNGMINSMRAIDVIDSFDAMYNKHFDLYSKNIRYIFEEIVRLQEIKEEYDKLIRSPENRIAKEIVKHRHILNCAKYIYKKIINIFAFRL